MVTGGKQGCCTARGFETVTSSAPDGGVRVVNLHVKFVDGMVAVAATATGANLDHGFPVTPDCSIHVCP